jgi:hypothetical protein
MARFNLVSLFVWAMSLEFYAGNPNHIVNSLGL